MKMSDHPFFSIVVPACDVGDYAGKMIASVRNQTFADFECLIVIEESKDNTDSAVAEAIGDDSRFAVYRLPRSGSASVPRNLGMARSRGDWLVFLDGDDWLEPDALETFHQTIQLHCGCDLLVTDAQTWAADGKGGLSGVVHPVSMFPLAAFPGDGIDFMSQAMRRHAFHLAVWFFIVRRSLLVEHPVEQPPGRLHQDNAWTWRVCMLSKALAFTRKVTYNYRRRKHSVTWLINTKSIFDMALNVREVIEYWMELKNQDASSRELRVAAEYLAYISGTRFLRLRTFRQFAKADCLKALRMIFATPELLTAARAMSAEMSFPRRMEFSLLIWGRHAWSFDVARLLGICEDFARSCYAKWQSPGGGRS